MIVCALLVCPFFSYASSSQVFRSALLEEESGDYGSLKQVGAFAVRKNAERLVGKLKKLGEKSFVSESVTKDNKTIYRVFVKEDQALNGESAGSPQKLTRSNKMVVSERSKVPEKPSYGTDALTQHGADRNIVYNASYRIFRERSQAEAYAKAVRKQGFNTVIQEDISDLRDIRYTVLSVKQDTPSASEYVLFDDEQPGRDTIRPADQGNIESADSRLRVNEKTSGGLLATGRVSRDAAVSSPLKGAPKGVPPDTVSRIAAAKRSSQAQAPSSAFSPDGAGSSVQPKEQQTDTVISAGRESAEKEPVRAALVTGGSQHDEAILPQAPAPENITVKNDGLGAKDVYGQEGGYIHPFVTFRSYFTDNVYHSRDNKESDFVFVISPGIWLTVPGVRQRLVSIDSSTITPGGFLLSRYNPQSFRRYQTYFFYGTDIELFTKNSSENFINHKIEGLFEYNLKSGFTLELVDRYLFTHDVRGTGTSDRLDKYKSNLFSAILMYDTRKRLLFRGDYSHYYVDYSSSRNSFRDRQDNAFSFYAFYRLSPKTKLLGQYRYIDVDYDKDTLSNSREHHYLGGVYWDITTKSRGQVKAGYGVKEFSRSSVGTAHNFIFESQIDYRFTPKTSVVLKGYRKTQESNIDDADYILSTGGSLQYMQRMTRKISASARVGYWNEQYKEDDVTLGDTTKKREDNIFEAGLSFRYDLKEWLKFDVGYLYTNRDSTFSEHDYSNNTFFVGLSGGLSYTLAP